MTEKLLRSPLEVWMRKLLAISSLLLISLIGFYFIESWLRSWFRPAPRVRHVIFISMDTTRADHFGCYGNKWIKTPNIDKLASESILFENSITAVPGTLASHTTLFTGKYPHSHGTPYNGFAVNPANFMLTEILKLAGFHTAGFIAAYPLHSDCKFNQGFDHWDEGFKLKRAGGSGQRPAGEVTKAVIEHLDATGVPDHLFLFAHYFDPHSPYAPPPPYDKMYQTDFKNPKPELKYLSYHCGLPKGGELDKDSKLRAAFYAGEVSYMDAQIGRLLDDLKERGILDDAILVLTSDHGENFWEHEAHFDHGATVFQTSIHIVSMIRLPKAAHAGKRVKALIGNVDVMPSVLRYMGLPIPHELDGEAFDLDHSEAIRTGIRYSEANQPASYVESDTKGWYNSPNSRCAFDGTYKYIRTPFKGSEEFYKLSADPCEFENLIGRPRASEDDAKMEELKAKLEEWDHSAKPLDSEFEKENREAAIKELENLGYLKP